LRTRPPSDSPGFALTTFVLSAHNAGWAPDVVWIGLALFYGGVAQFMAVSAAVIINSLSARPVPPVGRHLWSEARGGAAPRPFPTT
jgi:hypothetical protein